MGEKDDFWYPIKLTPLPELRKETQPASFISAGGKETF
jgi:hypothetical protein